MRGNASPSAVLLGVSSLLSPLHCVGFLPRPCRRADRLGDIAPYLYLYEKKSLSTPIANAWQMPCLSMVMPDGSKADCYAGAGGLCYAEGLGETVLLRYALIALQLARQ
jgi:hypothetical protein